MIIDRFNFSIKLKYVTLIAGVLLIMVSILIMYIYKCDLESIVQVVTLILLALTLIYTAINVHMIQENSTQSLELKKKENSFMLISQFNEPEMTKMSILSKRLKVEIKELDAHKVAELLKTDKEYQTAVVQMMNFYEKLAIAIEFKYADETILKDFFYGIINDTYNVMIEYILYLRKLHNSQLVFNRFEELAKKWN